MKLSERDPVVTFVPAPPEAHTFTEPLITAVGNGFTATETVPVAVQPPAEDAVTE